MVVQFRKDPAENKTYEILLGGKSVGWLYRQRYRGSPRCLKQYVGSWPAGYEWVCDPDGEPPAFPYKTFDYFKDAKAYLREQLA